MPPIWPSNKIPPFFFLFFFFGEESSFYFSSEDKYALNIARISRRGNRSSTLKILDIVSSHPTPFLIKILIDKGDRDRNIVRDTMPRVPP